MMYFGKSQYKTCKEILLLYFFEEINNHAWE